MELWLSIPAMVDDALGVRDAGARIRSSRTEDETLGAEWDAAVAIYSRRESQRTTPHPLTALQAPTPLTEMDEQERFLLVLDCLLDRIAARLATAASVK